MTAGEFGALMIIAARAHVRDKRLSPVSLLREWYEDPAVEQVQDEEEAFTPVHHLVQADTWLPGDFPFVVATEVPERDVILGSLAQLQLALADAGRILNTPNETTRKLAPKIVDDARRAHAAFEKIVARAAEQKAPILIDS